MMQLGEFTLVNEEKVQRVIQGTTDASGNMIPGLGEDAKEADILAAYDKLGGLITGSQGATVKTGSFYDFKGKAPRKKAEVVYQFRVNGEVTEIGEGEAMPMEAQAAQKIAARRTRKSAK